MNIWNIDKLFLFLIFFIPGFISIKIYDLIVPSERRDFSKAIYEAIGFSALNFAVLSWLIILIHSANYSTVHKGWYIFFIMIILFVCPILWPIIYLYLSTQTLIAKHVIHPIQKPWDYVFGKREPFWIIAHLKDGKTIAGKYDTDSFASSYPAEEQIYLEELWHVDKQGRFMKAIERSKGVIISGRDISALEFFE